MNRLLLFALLINCKLHAQTNYIDYNRGINKAEIHFIDNKIDSCLIAYKEVFKDFDKCLPNDAYVAGQIAVLHKDYESAYVFYRKGFEWGLNLKIFKRDLFFDDFKKDAYYTKLVNEFASIRKKYDQKIDTIYRNEIIDIRQRDLKANRTHILFNLLFFNKKAMRKLAKSSKLLLHELRLLIDKKGLPSIDKIGVHDVDILYNNPNLTGTGTTLLISTLYTHHGKAFEENEDILYKLLIQGDISAYYYAALKDISFNWDDFNKKRKEQKKTGEIKYYYYTRWLGSDTVASLSEEEKKEINVRRGSIGLMPIEYELKKKKIVIKSKEMDIDFNYWAL